MLLKHGFLPLLSLPIGYVYAMCIVLSCVSIGINAQREKEEVKGWKKMSME
jgi:hypothetical protein